MSAARRPARPLSVVLFAIAALMPLQAAGAGADRVEKLTARAEASLEQHDYEKAAKLFARADKAADGGSLRAVVGLTESLLHLQRYDDAIESARRWIRLAGTPVDRAAGYQYLGIAYHRRGLTERWKATRRAGRAGFPEITSGTLGGQAGDDSIRAAAEAFRSAAAELGSVGAHFVLLNLAEALSWLDEDEEALAALDAYAAAGGDDPWAREVRCWTQFGDEGEPQRAPAPGEPVTLEGGGEVEAPVKIYAPQPLYPLGARAARMEAMIVLHAIIDETGAVECVRPYLGDPYPLAHAAMEAVKRWRFEPARRQGEPIDVFYNLTVNFTLHR